MLVKVTLERRQEQYVYIEVPDGISRPLIHMMFRKADDAIAKYLADPSAWEQTEADVDLLWIHDGDHSGVASADYTLDELKAKGVITE